MPGDRRPWTVFVAAALLAVTGCTAGASRSAATPSAGASGSESTATATSARGDVPTPDHVVIVVYENKDAEQVVGSPNAPYLTSLSTSGADFTAAHAETHPSQPNYLALFSGSTQGVTDDSCPLVLHGDNLASQLLAAGKTFVGYSEDLPQAGATDCGAGEYRRKHNPWVSFADLPTGINQPYTALPDDYADLPTVSFLVPDLCNDMHDCDVATGDTWAKQNLAPYVEWAKSHNSLLVVTFDESEGKGDDPIATLLVGPMVQAGDTAQHVDHYSILRTIEEMYGLEPLGEAANRDPITDIWTSSAH
jgi:hypothetical protein